MILIQVGTELTVGTVVEIVNQGVQISHQGRIKTISFKDAENCLTTG